MKTAESASYTPEDIGIWVVLMATQSARLAALSRFGDRRDADVMLTRERWKRRHLVAMPAPPAVYWWPSPLAFPPMFRSART
jgi:hypothetical protein